MESLLMAGGDDSSSGESDNEVNVAPSPAAAVQPNVAAPASANTESNMSQSERAQRLKSMYSPATKAGGGGPVAAAPKPQAAVPRQQVHPAPVARQVVPAPVPRQPVPPGYRTNSVGALVPIQQQQQQQQGPPPQLKPQAPHRSNSGIPHQQIGVQRQPSTSMQQKPGIPRRPSVGSRPGMPPQQQQQQQQLQQQRGAPRMAHPGMPSSRQPPQQQTSRGGVPHQQIPSSRGVSSHAPPDRAPMPRMASDPFEPTPVSKIRERAKQQQQHHQKQQQMAKQQQQQRMSAQQQKQHQQQQQHQMGVPSSGGRGGPYGSSNDRSAERDLKKQKEKFLIFTRVLMKYLEQKDPPLHLKVKAIIKDCAERNRKKEPGYESVTNAMRQHLKKVVSDSYWKRAEAYLEHFLKEKAKSGSQSAALLANTSTAVAPPSSHSSADAMKRKLQRDEMQRQLALKQQSQHSSSQRPSQHAQQQQQPVQASLTSIRDEMAKKRQTLAAQTNARAASNNNASSSSTTKSSSHATKQKAASKSRSKSTATPTSSSTGGGGSGGGSATQQRKHSLPTDASLPASPLVATTPPAIREYNELMQEIESATNFDWTVAGSILGDETQFILSEEQRKLIYDSKTTMAASVGATTTSAPEFDTASSPLPEKAFPIPGWSDRNVLSARVGWARIRLGKRAPKPNPVVGGLSMPAVQTPDPSGSAITIEGMSDESSSPDLEGVESTWHNDQTAEQDKALAVLSEGVQMYLRSVLVKALHCARQRQNLDGIRLWHQQYTPGGGDPPPLSLRLGCDVTRQIAQADGNAAMTCKRMEEALDRQSNVPSRDRIMDDATLLNATSMSDLALRPKLGQAIAAADDTGKRSFEIYGGKHSKEPPFGRVPKKAKLEVIDFQTGMSFVRPGRHRASTVSSSFSF